jgi:hypothetical protein
MSEKWETFYLMVGSSAAALIGLLFVVVTLNAESRTAERETGSRMFLTPIVFHFAMVFLVSTLALMPDINTLTMALAVVAVGVAGLVFVGSNLIRMVFGGFPVPHWTDYIFYGLLPVILYAAFVACGGGMAREATFAIHGLAIAVLALLFLGIRDAWDLATWLAYHREGGK